MASRAGRQTARRKALYEQLHPEAKHGATGGSNACRPRTEVAKLATSVGRSTRDTAAATGKSERVVQNDAERGEKVRRSLSRVIHVVDDIESIGTAEPLRAILTLDADADCAEAVQTPERPVTTPSESVARCA